MPSLTIRLRGLAALGAAAFLAACAAEPADPGAKAQAAAPTAASSPQPVAAAGLAAGPVPAGFETLEVVTPQGRSRFFVEVADTEPKRRQGLMHRKSLAPDRGMLFDFKTVQPAAFWMKDTLIPLDIIYIREDGTILSIARNATPLSETPIPSGGPVLGVLELAGGRAAEIGALPGDRVEHRIFARD